MNMLEYPRQLGFSSILASALTLAVWLIHPGTGWAQSSSQPDTKTLEQAKNSFEAGREAYNTGQYEAAITLFEEANKLAPRPAIVFTLAQAYRRQYSVDLDPGHIDNALQLYKRYLAEVPQGRRRHDAVQHIETLESIRRSLQNNSAAQRKRATRRPATTQLMVRSATEGARASIDGGELSDMPLIREVTPGTHEIRVEAPGFFPRDSKGLAVEGRLIVVPIDLEPRPAEVSFRVPSGARIAIDGRTVSGQEARVPAGVHLVTAAKRGHYLFSRELTLSRGQKITVDASLRKTTKRKVSYYLLGGAAALVLASAATTTLSIQAQSRAQDIRNRLDNDGVNLTDSDASEYNGLISDRDNYRTTTYLLLGGALAVGTAGALLYWFDDPRAQATVEKSGLVPTVSASEVGVTWAGRFD
ncbi:MAG: PEGA domain-containing protein [Proteobacteria bacterium]|nr:PEGA domain-containing protein [Pseudomonadota bacterium]